MIRNAPRDAAVYGVDLGKNMFHELAPPSGHICCQAKRSGSMRYRH